MVKREERPIGFPLARSAGRETGMKQGYSGSSVRLVGDHVEKVASDRAFSEDMDRQMALLGGDE